MCSLVLLTATVTALVSERVLLSRLEPRELAQLASDTRIATERLAAVVGAARADVLAFAGGAPVLGVLAARAGGGVDPRDGSTEAQWRDRLEQSLLAQLEAKPDYLQIRLIGRDDLGREIVRVDRAGLNSAPRVVAGNLLQQKGTRPYFRDTIAMAAGQVYLSPIELNQENGKIEVPHRPVLRIASPVPGPDGAMVAIVIVNIDMARVFAEVRAAVPEDREFVVMNRNGHYLLGPDPVLDFGFELGRPAGLADRFPGLAPLGRRTGLFTDREGNDFALAVEPLRFGPNTQVFAAQTVPYATFAAVARATNRAMALGGLFAVGAAAALALFLARSLARPLTQVTRALQDFRGDTLPDLPRNIPGEIGRLSEAVTRMAQDIHEKSASLGRSNAELEQFAYSVSHDLKGPLTTISGLLDIGLDDLDGGDVAGCRAVLRDALEVCRRNAAKIEAVLDIARAGTGPVPVVPVDLAAEVRLIWHDLTGSLAKPPDLSLSVDGPAAFTTERQTLLTICENLLSNAVRYVDRGKPVQWVRVRGRISATGLDLEFADNGIGIPGAHHAQVFGMFNRFSERSGSGLGLSLVKKHVDRLKGKISFESSGEGTSFVLSLPAG